jgi:hypothetical protein
MKALTLVRAMPADICTALTLVDEGFSVENKESCFRIKITRLIQL